MPSPTPSPALTDLAPAPHRPAPGDTGPVSGAPGDFEDFVTARWRELHAVATLTTGDADDGARVTASALAALGRRWAETVDEGNPTAAARVAVLSAALAAAGGAAAPPREGDETTESPDPAEADDGTRVALAGVLAATTPTARAAVAVEHWWDETPALVAATAHTDLATVQSDLSVLRRQLAAAHAASVGGDEAELGGALSAATTETLEHAADAAAVSDPVALVEDARTKGTRRRRTRLAVVGVAVAVGAATALAWPGAGTPTPSGPARDSALWASVSTWSPRGPLVDDDTVRSIAAEARAADPTASLLYAGRVGDTLALVMTGSSPADPTLPAGVPGPALARGSTEGPFLRLWTAAARLGPGALGPAVIDGEPTARTSDLVALLVEQDTTGAPPAVLVLTRPTVTDAYVTTNVLPQADGSLRSIVHALPLVDGVASYTGTSFGRAPRVAVPGYEGWPAGAGSNYDLDLPRAGPGADLADHQRILLADVTGLPAGDAADHVGAGDRRALHGP